MANLTNNDKIIDKMNSKIEIVSEMPEVNCTTWYAPVVYTGIYHAEDGFRPGTLYVLTERDSYDFTTDHTLDTNDDYDFMNQHVGEIWYNTTDDYYFTIAENWTSQWYDLTVDVTWNWWGWMEFFETVNVWSKFSNLVVGATLYDRDTHQTALYYITEKYSSYGFHATKLSTWEQVSVQVSWPTPMYWWYEEIQLWTCYRKEFELSDMRLAALKDVNLYSLKDGDVIERDATNGKWINRPGCITWINWIKVYSPKTYTDYSKSKGPCPKWFHIPKSSELGILKNIIDNTDRNILPYLWLCYSWHVDSNGTVVYAWSTLFLWSSSQSWYSSSSWYSMYSYSVHSSQSIVSSMSLNNWACIRPFHDWYVEPDSSWTTQTYGSNCTIYKKWDLISVVCWNNKITIAAYNLWQTETPTTQTDARPETIGYYYQWWNNYGKMSAANWTSWYMTINTANAVRWDQYDSDNPYISEIWNSNSKWLYTQPSGNTPTMRWVRSNPQLIDCSVVDFDPKDISILEFKDVNAASIKDWEVLTWDATNQEFINTTIEQPIGSYNDLTDKLVAGDNITIGDKCVMQWTVQWPCDDGFHIPTKAEWDSIIALNLTSAQVVSALHIPYGGIRRHNDGSFDYVRSEARLWVSNAITGSGDIMNNYYAYISQYATAVIASNTIALGCNIRAFKNTPVVPDATWTETVEGKVREKDGLISILVDTDTYVTMQNKNVGATTVWNTGDTASSENIGDYFQWGNNHGFKLNSTGDTSSTQVDASSYWPGEYDSDTFVIGQIDWMSVDNYDLWWAETGCAVEHNVISANVQAASKDSDIAFTTINMTGREVIFNNEFITNTTLVNYTITNGWYPNGTIVASVDNGSLTIESSEEESNLQFFVKFEKTNNNSTILS